jgi:hypothetical protein
MKCPICGKHTLPGAKLCGPCRAALKRAKDDSVWELPPSQRQGEAQAAPQRPAQWVLGSPRFNGWRGWALGGAALALCVVVGLQYARSVEPAAALPAQPNAAARPIAESTPPAPSQRALPDATQTVVAPTPTRNTQADDALVQPPRSEQSVPRAPKTTRSPVEPVAQPPAPAIEPPPSEPVRVAAPPPPPQPARPVDPMQRLQDALGRCSGQDLFSRLGCEYRARTTYCEGHWGESPQCPAPTSNDHGQ